MKKINLIEFFAGVGAQHMALRYLGLTKKDYNIQSIVEWQFDSILEYYELHKDHIRHRDYDYSKGISVDKLVDYFVRVGVSLDYNKPASRVGLKRRGEDDLRKCYNAIIKTNNLVNIMNVRGEDLYIVDKDKNEYLITYSFPCQDLSNAGIGKGMKRDTGTRSGLLWEVERILNECENLPQTLVMENVPAIHNKNNIEEFEKWQKALNEMGYTNYISDLVGTDFGVPQKRKRTFMVSVLNDRDFNFPEVDIDLKPLEMFLDKYVDEEYYLSFETVERVLGWNSQQKPLKDIDKYKETSPTLLTSIGKISAAEVIVNEKTFKYKGLYNYTGGRKFMEGKDRYKEDSKLAPVLLTQPKQALVILYEEGFRLRILTPNECFRLMGFKDEDYKKLVSSKRKKYHAAGDTIIVPKLMGIFGELFGIDYEQKIKDLINNILDNVKGD